MRGWFLLLKSIIRESRLESWVIPGVLYANVGMFVLSLLIHPLKTGLSLNPLTFLSPDNGSLILMGATGVIPIHRFGRWWTLISANYLHGSVLHILKYAHPEGLEEAVVATVIVSSEVSESAYRLAASGWSTSSAFWSSPVAHTR